MRSPQHRMPEHRAPEGCASERLASEERASQRSAAESLVSERHAASFERVAEALRRGEPAVFPTDTVCGVGVSVESAASPDVLFRLKRRPAGKPVAWLVADLADLDCYGRDVPALARTAARAFWPGGLTLIVSASEKVPPAFRSSAGTVGLRMPADPLALALIRAVGAPLATTSANFSGNAAPATLGEADPAFLAQVAAVLDDAGAESAECVEAAGDAVDSENAEVAATSVAPAAAAAVSDAARAAVSAPVDVAPAPLPASATRIGTPAIPATDPQPAGGVASTVLDCTCDPPRILRQGAVSADALERLRMSL